MIYIASDDERLDSIVYKYYKSLDNFALVLELNSNLANKTHLSAGDIVILPEIKKEDEIEELSLW